MKNKFNIFLILLILIITGIFSLYWFQMRSPQIDQPYQVYGFGDSLTDGMLSRATLENYLGSRFRVNNAGNGGDNTTQMLARITTSILKHNDAQFVIVWGGVDDVDQTVAAATIESNLQTIFNDLHASKIKVISVNISPFAGAYKFNGTKQTILNTVNTWLANTATNIDVKIDIYKELEDPGKADHLLAAYDLGDHVHLTAVGYDRVAQVIYANSGWIFNRTLNWNSLDSFLNSWLYLVHIK